MRVFESADPAWFYIHVSCQFSAYVIGVAGWSIGIKLGNESEGIRYASHGNIGLALFTLATIQVNYKNNISKVVYPLKLLFRDVS